MLRSTWILVFLAAGTVGCHPDLLTTGAARAPAPPGDWQPAGNELQPYGLGVRFIRFGSIAHGELRRSAYATISTSVVESGVRASLLWSNPSLALWDQDGLQLFCVEAPAIAAVRITPKGSLLFVTNEGLMQFDTVERTVAKRLSFEKSNVEISPDGRLLAIAVEEEGKQRIHVLEIDTGNLVSDFEVPGHWAWPAAFLDSNRLLAVIGDHVRVTIQNLETDQWIADFHADSVKGAFSSDGSRFAAVSRVGDEEQVSIRDTKLGSVVMTTSKNTGAIWSVAFSQDGRLLAAGGEGTQRGKPVGEIRVRDAETGKELATLIDESAWGITAVEFSPDDNVLAGGTSHGHVRFWKVPSNARPAAGG